MSKKVIKAVRCMDCANAEIWRSSKLNPWIATCNVSPIKERNVASTVFRCEKFKPKS